MISMVYVERELEKQLKKYLKTREIIAIIGPRQCGKTTLALQILDKLEKVNKIKFDDIKTLKLFDEDIDSFIQKHVMGFNYLFIDEVQYSKDSGKKLKFIYDSTKIKIIISGSSAPDLSISSLKYLVGRIFIFKLYPFSFREFILAKEPKLSTIYEKGEYSTTIEQELNKYLQEYMTFGGYPRVVLAKNSEEKITVLDNIYNTFLLKEIREILELSENDKLIKLMKALALQIGSPINYNELSNTTQFSHHQLKRYLKILEETYICKLLTPYYTNKRTELVKQPKVYFIDLGFRNACINNFSIERSDKGAMFENVVFSDLLKHEIPLNFWQSKGGAEVDFIIKERIPLEAKSNIKNLPRSYLAYLEKYNPKIGYIATSKKITRKVNNTTIRFMPYTSIIAKKNIEVLKSS